MNSLAGNKRLGVLSPNVNYDYQERDEALIRILEPGVTSIDSKIMEALLIEEVYTKGFSQEEAYSEVSALGWTMCWDTVYYADSQRPYDGPPISHTYRDGITEAQYTVLADYKGPPPADTNERAVFNEYAMSDYYCYGRKINRTELSLVYSRKPCPGDRKWKRFFSRRLFGYKWWIRELDGIIKHFELPYVGR